MMIPPAARGIFLMKGGMIYWVIQEYIFIDKQRLKYLYSLVNQSITQIHVITVLKFFLLNSEGSFPNLCLNALLKYLGSLNPTL